MFLGKPDKNSSRSASPAPNRSSSTASTGSRAGHPVLPTSSLPIFTLPENDKPLPPLPPPTPISEYPPHLQDGTAQFIEQIKLFTGELARDMGNMVDQLSKFAEDVTRTVIESEVVVINGSPDKDSEHRERLENVRKEWLQIKSSVAEMVKALNIQFQALTNSNFQSPPNTPTSPIMIGNQTAANGRIINGVHSSIAQQQSQFFTVPVSSSVNSAMTPLYPTPPPSTTSTPVPQLPRINLLPPLASLLNEIQTHLEESKRARLAAEAANAQKSAFLANIVHEIRTPIHGIIGMTSLTVETELTGSQRENLITVSGLANGLVAIVDDVLDISKIEANKMTISPHPTQLRHTLFSTLKTLAVRASQKKLALLFQLDPDIPDYVILDRQRLLQIVTNLVGNAIKFTPAGGKVALGAQLAYYDKNTGKCTLEFNVRDTGIGIAPEKHQQIFDSFAQAEEKTSSVYGGTGLGLSISKRLVGLMGGELWVESEVGRGACFFWSLPVTVVYSGPSDEDANGVTLGSGLEAIMGRRIAVLGDEGEAPLTPSLFSLLRELPVEIVQLNTLEDMVPETAASEGPDILILFGLDAAISLRQTRPDLRSTPLIVTTNPQVDQPLNMKQCIDTGVTTILSLPTNRQTLLNTLVASYESLSMPSASAARGDLDGLVIRDGSNSSIDRPPLRILLAEDNPINQKLAIRILEKLGHTVVTCSDGREAVNTYAASVGATTMLEENSASFIESQPLSSVQEFDMVLMDVQMPIMGGFEATRRIRALEQSLPPGVSAIKDRGGRIPIIALTAYAMVGDRERCIEAGMDEYVTKPLRFPDLVAAMEKFSPARKAPISSPAQVDGEAKI